MAGGRLGATAGGRPAGIDVPMPTTFFQWWPRSWLSATVAQARYAVDAAFANIWPHLVARQEAQLARTGRFVQFLATANQNDLPNVLPGAGLAPVPVIDLNLPGTPPCVARCDVSDTPEFYARLWVRFGGNVYTRAKSYGSGAASVEAWRQLAAEEIAERAARIFNLGSAL